MSEQTDQQEIRLVQAVDAAREATRQAHAVWRGIRIADAAMRRAGMTRGDVLPAWAGGAVSAADRDASARYAEATAHAEAALRELSEHMDRRIAAAQAPVTAVKG